ncbi:MAG: 4-hydroxybenzoyl-CoA thioesterase [Oceanospirillaceae bacterium]|jgi:4-hydroxybenzoyl-CoA thioesterase
MSVYQIQQRVLFQHCDPAGIVFYPRYFEMINATVEQWFADELGFSFAKMHLTEKVGVPTAAIQTSFKAPSFLEDRLDFSLKVTKIGTKSADIAIQVHCEEQLRLTTELTLVFVSLTQATPKSIPWSDGLRQKMQTFTRL